MGILDDAIKEHLELKRKHGADSSDLERLQSEAFGPATRPGDPDFEDEAAAQSAGEQSTGEAEVPEAQATAPEPTPESDGGDWLQDLEDKLEHAPSDPGPAAPETAEEPPGSATEQARLEHTDLADTVDHPAVPDPETAEEPFDDGLDDEGASPDVEAPPEPQDAPEAAAPPEAEAASEPAEAPEPSIFGADDDAELGDLDLDLDLDLEDAAAAPAEPDSAEFELELPGDAAVEHPLPPAEEAEPTDDETDEHEAEPAPEQPVEPAPEQPPEQPPEPAPEPPSDEDLLEETPEFLKEAPDGESLWFEQAPPKDFDFDED